MVGWMDGEGGRKICREPGEKGAIVTGIKRSDFPSELSSSCFLSLSLSLSLSLTLPHSPLLLR